MANNKKQVGKKTPTGPIAGHTKGKEVVENNMQPKLPEPLPEPSSNIEETGKDSMEELQVQPEIESLEKEPYISEGPNHITDFEIGGNYEFEKEENPEVKDVCECIKEPRNLTDCIDMQNMITEFLDEYRTSLVDGGTDSSKLNRLNLAINHSGMTEHNLKIQRDTLQAEL